MKFKIPLTLSVVTALLLTGGCTNEPIITSQTEQIEISLSWWGNDARNEYTHQAVVEFQKLYPNIRVKCNYSEWSGYQTRYNVRMVSNTEADVMQINYAWIEQYSHDGSNYYDINELSDYIDLSNFSEEELSYGMQNGKLNAIPIALNTYTVYINKTVYEQYGLDVPETWDDLFNAGKVMNGETYPISMPIKGAWFYITSYAEQVTGKTFMENDGTLNFDADDFKIMLDFYCRLINEKVMPQVEYFDKLSIDTGVYAGTVAWLSDASNYCDNASENGFEMVVANYTALDSTDAGTGWYAKPATMFAISKNTEHPEESALLLNFLLNSTENAELQGIEKGIPISKSALNYLEENDMLVGIQYEAFQKMNEYSSEISVISPYFENTDLIEVFNQYCNNVLYGKQTSDEASKQLYQDLKTILED